MSGLSSAFRRVARAGRRAFSREAAPISSPDPEWLQRAKVAIPGFAEALAIEQGSFDTWRCLRPSAYVGKDVVDLGCGIGAATALFAKYGARSVRAIDPELTDTAIEQLSSIPRSQFVKGILTRETIGEACDLVYSRVVTEHIYDLPTAFAIVYDVLRPGGRFVGLHDNFYGPMGAHDQGLFEPSSVDGRRIESRAVPCWDSPRRCDASREFRERFEKEWDWHAKDWVLTPEDCSRCSYYRRTRPWAHLLYQDEYRHLFAGEFFQTRTDGALNKVTPFQLRQFLVEAGLRVTFWDCQRVKNRPPRELMRRFSVADLQTGPILLAADKATGAG